MEVAVNKISRNPVCKLLFTIKPKIPKHSKPSERNVKGISITINFHSSRGKETFLKAKLCSKFPKHALLHDHMLKLILCAKAKA